MREESSYKKGGHVAEIIEEERREKALAKMAQDERIKYLARSAFKNEDAGLSADKPEDMENNKSGFNYNIIRFMYMELVRLEDLGREQSEGYAPLKEHIEQMLTINAPFRRPAKEDNSRLYSKERDDTTENDTIKSA